MGEFHNFLNQPFHYSFHVIFEQIHPFAKGNAQKTMTRRTVGMNKDM